MHAENLTLWGKLKRWLLTRFKTRNQLTYGQLAHYDLLERPHYAYCVYNAADLAARLGLDRIALIEFGVAGGNGLVALERITEDIRRAAGLNVEFEIYGFDTGQGMPPPKGQEDLPYWFAEGQYAMDEAKLRARLKRSDLVIGDIRETVPRFHESHAHAPIGAMMVDVDYHSSTLDCLEILKSATPERDLLPRLSIYLDDVIGGPIEMYGPVNGILRAVDEFNAAHDRIAVHMNRNLLPKAHLPYRTQIYYAHLLDHPLYDTYVGGSQQDALQQALRLRA